MKIEPYPDTNGGVELPLDVVPFPSERPDSLRKVQPKQRSLLCPMAAVAATALCATLCVLTILHMAHISVGPFNGMAAWISKGALYPLGLLTIGGGFLSTALIVSLVKNHRKAAEAAEMERKWAWEKQYCQDLYYPQALNLAPYQDSDFSPFFDVDFDQITLGEIIQRMKAANLTIEGQDPNTFEKHLTHLPYALKVEMGEEILRRRIHPYFTSPPINPTLVPFYHHYQRKVRSGWEEKCVLKVRLPEKDLPEDFKKLTRLEMIQLLVHPALMQLNYWNPMKSDDAIPYDEWAGLSFFRNNHARLTPHKVWLSFLRILPALVAHQKKTQRR